MDSLHQHRMTLLQLLVLFGYFSSCLSKTGNCLGIQEYEDTHQICCAGSVTELVDDQKCCGGKHVYNPNKELCCDTQVSQRYEKDDHGKSVELQCCGGQLHPKKGFYCCSDTLVNLTEQQEKDRNFLECCSATKVANNRDKFCCGGRDYENSENLMCCNNEIMVKDHLWCYNDEQAIDKNENICGEEKYDMRNASCCNDKINHLIPQIIDGKDNLELKCCDTIPYKKGERKCCPHVWGQSSAHVIPVGLQCCGDTHYNKSKGEECVNNKPRLKVYDSKICHRNGPDCCNGQVINTETQQCCKGLFGTTIISKDEKCCNGHGLHENELCCFGRACAKEANEDNDCCINYDTDEIKTYCNSTQACNGLGQVVTKSPGTQLCGNHLSFKPEEEICCGMSNKVSKSDGFSGCCDDQPFKNKSQQCCVGKVYDYSRQERRCCILDGNVYAKNDETNPCLEPCSDSFYDPDTHICCNGTVRRARPNRQCCGGRFINTDKRECCNMETSFRKGRNKTCCGGLGINSVKLQCCAEKIPFKPKSHGCCNHMTVYRLDDYNCSNGKVTRKGKMKDFSLRQMFCHKDTLWHGDSLVEVACQQDVYAVRGIFQDAAISKRVNGTYEFDLWISSVLDVNIHDHFTTKRNSLRSLDYRYLNVIVTLSVKSDVKCRRKTFRKFKGKKVYLFLKKKPFKRIQKINENDFIFMTKYSKLKRKVLSQLSSQFCHYILR